MKKFIDQLIAFLMIVLLFLPIGSNLPVSAASMSTKDVTRGQVCYYVNELLGAKIESEDMKSIVNYNVTDEYYTTMSIAYNAGYIKASKNHKLTKASTRATYNYVAGIFSGLLNEPKTKLIGTHKLSESMTVAKLKSFIKEIIPNVVAVDLSDKKLTGNTLINKPNVTLSNVTITGNLIIGDGVDNQEVILDNVKVSGKLIVRGGGENSIKIIGTSSIPKVEIIQVNHKISIKVSDNAEVGYVTIEDGCISSGATGPIIITPPSWVPFDTFYQKCVIVDGIPICSTSSVSDKALINSSYILDTMLKKIITNKPNIYHNLLINGIYEIIIGLNENNVDHPSWSNYTETDVWPRRGGGGCPTTVLEEDVDVSDDDTYLQNFCVLVHEFAHTILMYGIGDLDDMGDSSGTYDNDLLSQIVAAYKEAKAAGKYTESAYDLSNYHEYFAGQVSRWFNANPTNLNVLNASSKTDREQLMEYDPTIYNILDTLFGKYELPGPWN